MGGWDKIEGNEKIEFSEDEKKSLIKRFQEEVGGSKRSGELKFRFSLFEERNNPNEKSPRQSRNQSRGDRVGSDSPDEHGRSNSQCRR